MIEFNINEFTVLFLAFLIYLLILYIKKIQNAYKFFEKIGLKNPPVRFFFGNFFELTKDCRERDVIREWGLKYGKTYGYFEGHTPILVTSDIEILNEILVTQYSNFSARKRRPLDPPDTASRVNLITGVETRWKNMRHVLSPLFSGLRLRNMNQEFKMCTDRLINVLEKDAGKEIDIRGVIKAFTMDCTWNCIFGIEINSQLNNEKSIYAKKTEEALEIVNGFSNIGFLTTFLEEFRWIILSIFWKFQDIRCKLAKYSLFKKYLNPLLTLRESFVELMEERLRSGVYKKDVFDIAIEAHTNDPNEMEKLEKIDFQKVHTRKKLSIEEIKMNLGLVALGSYDTPAAALNVCLFALASHLDEQKKLIAEVDEHFPEHSEDEPNTDNIKELKYMKCFIDEVLRFYVIEFKTLNRRCMHPTKIKGIHFPKGLEVQIDLISLHRDPDLWGPEDPNKFFPERFKDERKRHPLAFLGFGGGPRLCLGIKFAYVQIQIALAKILRKFEVKAGDNFKEKYAYIEGISTQLIEPINLIFIKRNQD